LGYSDYVGDRRVQEKKDILDFIVSSFQDCEVVVFMGDNFNSKNNSSETNREFVEFVERFGNKDVFIICGNHEKKGDGSTAIDFLGEVKRPNWHIFTQPSSFSINGKKLDFLPYMLNQEIGVTTCEEATKEIVDHLDGGDVIFAHHAISGTTFNGIKTELLKEIVLPKEELEKKYKKVVAGHIHQPQIVGNTLITGSLFTNEVGEIEKFIFKIDDSLNIEQIKVPARGIYKLVDPSIDDITKLPKKSIAKIILTKRGTDIESIKIVASGLDAHVIIEDYPNERKKMHIEENAAFDFSIEALLKMYSEERGVDYNKLIKGLELIK
jgi:hypothetical protein